MKAMRKAASGGEMRGPRGGVYRIVGGKKVYGHAQELNGSSMSGARSEHAKLRQSAYGFANHAVANQLMDKPAKLHAAINEHYDKNAHVRKEHPSREGFHRAVKSHVADFLHDAEGAGEMNGTPRELNGSRLRRQVAAKKK